MSMVEQLTHTAKLVELAGLTPTTPPAWLNEKYLLTLTGLTTEEQELALRAQVEKTAPYPFNRAELGDRALANLPDDKRKEWLEYDILEGTRILLETPWVDQHRVCESDLCEGGTPAEYNEKDHRLPKRWGGTDDKRNLHYLCRPCHRLKSKLEWHLSRGGKPEWIDEWSDQWFGLAFPGVEAKPVSLAALRYYSNIFLTPFEQEQAAAHQHPTPESSTPPPTSQA